MQAAEESDDIPGQCSHSSESSPQTFFWKQIDYAYVRKVRPHSPLDLTRPLVVPPPMCCLSMVPYGDQFLITFGGGSQTGMYSDVFVFDLNTYEWTHPTIRNSELAIPRIVHSAIVYGDAMIVFGGQSIRQQGVLEDVLRLDLKSWVWSMLECRNTSSDLGGPGPREYHTAHLFEDRMYVIMGLNENNAYSTPNNAAEEPEPLVWYLDLLTLEWQTVSWAFSHPPLGHQAVERRRWDAEAPRQSLGGHAAAMEKDVVYIFGGASSILNEHSYSNELYAFHLKTHQWKRFAVPTGSPKPPARYGGTMSVCEGVVYTFGGDRPQEMVSFGDFWRIDTQVAEPRWEELPLFISPLQRTLSHSSGEKEEESAAMDGREEEAMPNLDQNCSSTDPSEAKVVRSWHNWERPSPRSGCAYATVQGVFFLFGGEASVLKTEESGGVDQFPEGPFASLDRLPCGPPTVIHCATDYNIVYSNALFAYPLTVHISGEGRKPSLRDLSALWISSEWVRTGAWVPTEVERIRHEEPAGVRHAFQRCICSRFHLEDNNEVEVNHR